MSRLRHWITDHARASSSHWPLPRPLSAAAASCPDNPNALGTERIIEVDAGSTPRVGRKHFRRRCRCSAKELVLTFDDGPWPGTTAKVLDALKTECVRATFFLLGRNAAAHPQLARRALAEGHTLGHHSYSHPLLSRMAIAKAEAEIDRGIAADETRHLREPPHQAGDAVFPLSRLRLQPARCSTAWRRAASRFSAPMSGRATGCHDPEQELRLILSASSRSDAASCCFTIPKRRPPGCSRPSCANSNAGVYASSMSSRKPAGIHGKCVACLPRLQKNHWKSALRTRSQRLILR